MYRWLKAENVISLPEALRRVTAEKPRRIALDFVLKVHPVSFFKGKIRFNLVIGKQISYETLGKLARKFSKFFDLILKNHDQSETVAIFTLNCPQFWGAYFGAQFSGAIPALISPATIIKELRAKKPIEEIRLTAEIKNQILDAKPSVIVVTDFLWPILRQMYNDLEGMAVLLTRLSDTLPFYWRQAYEKVAREEGRWIKVTESEAVMFSEALKNLPPKDWSEVIIPPKESIAHLIYTGGTTGIPKGAMTTHANCMSNVLQCREQLDEYISDGESVFGTMPFFHSYGIIVALMTFFSINGTLTFPPTFEPKEVVYLLKKREIQIFAGINRMFKALSSVPALEKLPHLKLCISGAGKLDKNVKDEFEEKTGAKIVEGYGLTEASPVISLTTPSEDKPRTIGRPLPGTTVKLVDLNTGREVGPGEVGEIVVRGPQVMMGYYKKPEETAKILTDDGWLRTGDTAYRDEKGFLYFVGREKEMSKINGENVFWLDVERHFLTNDAIDQKCAVIGVPRPGYGDEEQLVVFVVLKAGKNLTDLRETTKAAKAKNWLIKEIIAVNDKVFGEWEDAIGKVQKRKVKKYYEEKSK